MEKHDDAVFNKLKSHLDEIFKGGERNGPYWRQPTSYCINLFKIFREAKHCGVHSDHLVGYIETQWLEPKASTLTDEQIKDISELCSYLKAWDMYEYCQKNA